MDTSKKLVSFNAGVAAADAIVSLSPTLAPAASVPVDMTLVLG